MSSVTRVNRPIASASRPQSNSHHSSSALRSTEPLLQADRSVFTRTGRSVLQMGMWVSVEAWWHHGSVDISALPPPVPPQSFFLSSTCKGCKSVQLQVEASPRLQRDLNYLSIHREQTEECVLSKGRCCAGVSSC